MALGLGGLYLLVRIRAEAGAGAELEDTSGTSSASSGDAASPDPPIHSRVDGVPMWARDENLWERAKERVRPHWHQYREPWAVVAHVYEQMGGRPV